MARLLTKSQIDGVNEQVTAATPKLDAFIEGNAGMFAGAVERDLASAAGKKLILDIIESAYMAGWSGCAKAAAAAGKAAT